MRSMWATSLPSPTSDSPTMKELAMRASPPSLWSGPGRLQAAVEGPAEVGRASYTMPRMPVKQASGADTRDVSAWAGRRSPEPRSWRAFSRPARRSPATSRRATISTTRPTRTCCAARSRSGRRWAGRASAGRGDGAGRRARDARACAGANTNLGIALLLAPLAARRRGDRRARLEPRARRRSTVDDARAAYEAIRLAGAGGLDDAGRARRARRAVVTLREAMAAAAGRDAIAAEYASGYAMTFGLGLPRAASRAGGRAARRATRSSSCAAAAGRGARHADRAQARDRPRPSACRRARRACSRPAACARRTALAALRRARCARTATRSTPARRPTS